MEMTNEKIKKFLPMRCSKDYGWRQAGIHWPPVAFRLLNETVRESLILVKNISKFLTVQTAGVNVDVKEVGPDVVTIAAKMDIAATKMDADHALEKWHNF